MYKEGELGQRRKEKSPFEKITLLDYKSWKLVCNFAPGDQTANQECCREQNGIPNKLAMSKKPIQHRIKAHKENKFIQPTLSEFLITCTSFSHRSLSSSSGTVWRRKNESHFINHLLVLRTPKNVLQRKTQYYYILIHMHIRVTVEMGIFVSSNLFPKHLIKEKALHNSLWTKLKKKVRTALIFTPRLSFCSI